MRGGSATPSVPHSIGRRATGNAGHCEREHVINTFIQRLIGAATLDGRTYEEVDGGRLSS
jgi:hypothetical protein